MNLSQLFGKESVIAFWWTQWCWWSVLSRQCCGVKGWVVLNHLDLQRCMCSPNLFLSLPWQSSAGSHTSFLSFKWLTASWWRRQGHARLMDHGRMAWKELWGLELCLNLYQCIVQGKGSCGARTKRTGAAGQNPFRINQSLPTSTHHKWPGLEPEQQPKGSTTQRSIPERHIQLNHHPLHWVQP